MEKESFERSSAKIEHDPALAKYNEVHAKEIEQSKKNIIRGVCFGLSILVIFAIMKFGDYVIQKLDYDESSWASTIYCNTVYWLCALVVAANIYSTIYFFIMILKILFTNTSPENIFFQNALGKFSIQISLVLTFYFFQFVLKPSEFFRYLDHFNAKNVWIQFGNKPDPKDAIHYYLAPMITKMLAMIFMKNFVIYALNFNIHYRYYQKRIDLNIEKITVLRAMNDVINAGYTGDVDVIANRLIQVVSSNKSTISLLDLIKFFGESMAHRIFNFCDKNDDNEIEEEEIKSFYISTLSEQLSIVKSIDQHNLTVESFNGILTMFMIPMFIFFVLSIDPVSKQLGTNLLTDTTFLTGLVFSTSYTFSDSIKNFMNSLGFVFLVRPYEIGDLIYTNEKLYKVHEINLFTSVLYDGCNYVIFPNSKLSGEAIKNLRLNKVMDVEYKCRFNPNEFGSKGAALLAKIDEFMKKKSSEFRKSPFFKKVEVVDEGKVEAILTVKLNCEVADIETLTLRRTNFFSKLEQMLVETGIRKEVN